MGVMVNDESRAVHVWSILEARLEAPSKPRDTEPEQATKDRTM